MFPNFLRTCPSLITFAKGIVELMQHFSWKHLAVITQEEDLFTLVNCIKLICMIHYSKAHVIAHKSFFTIITSSEVGASQLAVARTVKCPRRPGHSGKNIGKVISPFLAGTEEPITVHYHIHMKYAHMCTHSFCIHTYT